MPEGEAVHFYTNSGVRWQVVAFRAVRDGELKIIQDLCEQQPVLLHDRFTKEMEDWELEFESLKWFQFKDTTCLFIAAAYCQAAIVEWLLENGVDEDEKCYMSQVPLDVVGNCHWDDADAAVGGTFSELVVLRKDSTGQFSGNINHHG